MVDDRRREARRVQGNVTTGGRYGDAPGDQPHVEPEVPPRGLEGVELGVPPSPLAGDLPENRGQKEEEPSPERATTRLPDATARALHEGTTD